HHLGRTQSPRALWRSLHALGMATEAEAGGGRTWDGLFLLCLRFLGGGFSGRDGGSGAQDRFLRAGRYSSDSEDGPYWQAPNHVNGYGYSRGDRRGSAKR